MNKNIVNQLISRIINKLSGIKPFINIIEFDDSYQKSVIVYENNTQVKYESSVISISVEDLEYNLDNYNLIIHILNKIMLDLTMNVVTKNYYFIDETIEEDIANVMDKLEKVTWFMTYETHLELLEMLKYEGKNWTDFQINGKKIHTMESSFPKSLIFGCEHPVIINPKHLKSELFDGDRSVIKIPYYYVKDFYAMRLISDEEKRKVVLRNKKIKKLRK